MKVEGKESLIQKLGIKSRKQLNDMYDPLHICKKKNAPAPNCVQLELIFYFIPSLFIILDNVVNLIYNCKYS